MKRKRGMLDFEAGMCQCPSHPFSLNPDSDENIEDALFFPAVAYCACILLLHLSQFCPSSQQNLDKNARDLLRASELLIRDPKRFLSISNGV